MPTLAPAKYKTVSSAVSTVVQIETRDSANLAGLDAVELRKVAMQAKSDLHRVVSACSTASHQDSAYSPFPEIRKLKAGFDGQRSLPPDEKLIACGEKIWEICTSLSDLPYPRVAAGPDQFLTFDFKDARSGKRLTINVYNDEESDDEIVLDWLLERPSELDRHDTFPFSTDAVRSLLLTDW